MKKARIKAEKGRIEREKHRQLQAQHQLRLSIELYKTAQPFSIILLQLYAQLVRFDQTNIVAVRHLLETYMEHTHANLLDLTILCAPTAIQTRWLETLARKLLEFVGGNYTSEEDRLTKYNSLLQKFAAERKREYESAQRHVPGRRDSAASLLPPRHDAKPKSRVVVAKNPRKEAWGSPVKELNVSADPYGSRGNEYVINPFNKYSVVGEHHSPTSVAAMGLYLLNYHQKC